MLQVRKAIIPAAGLGSRMRSISGGLPKELLPVGSKPMIQLAVEMHVKSGVEEIAVILHPEKDMIRDFLEGRVLSGLPYSDRVRGPDDFKTKVSFRFFYQNQRRGVVDAVMLAREFVKDEPFALVMPDCVLFSARPFLAQIMDQSPPDAQGVIGFIMLEKERSEQFGNVGLLTIRREKGPLYRVLELSDKGPGSVGFTERVRAKGFGGGIYGPEYFQYVPAALQKGGIEIDDVPIHQAMAAQNELLGVHLEGTAFDLGNMHGYVAANEFCENKTM